MMGSLRGPKGDLQYEFIPGMFYVPDMTDPQQSLVSSNRNDHLRTPSQSKVCLPAEYLQKVMKFRTCDMSSFQL